LIAIRDAHRDDANRLAQLAETTFRATFAATNTAGNMDSHCRASYGETIQAGEIADPDMVTLLCEEDDRLIGYAQLRWGHAPDCVRARSPGEIQRLYVANDWHGKGVAQKLMAACMDEMTAYESDVVWLGVWERNPRAIAFYRKFGFVEVGDHVFPLGSDPQRDIVMARSLAGWQRSAPRSRR
jgi:ribosomal protein S18 acetylase RimI-like enzyme